MRPDISVSALPHASQAHLRDICPYYICLSSLDSWISYIRMFCICICGDRGSYFRLFVYDHHLSTWPSADEQRWQRFGIRKNGNINSRKEALVWPCWKVLVVWIRDISRNWRNHFVVGEASEGEVIVMKVANLPNLPTHCGGGMPDKVSWVQFFRPDILGHV